MCMCCVYVQCVWLCVCCVMCVGCGFSGCVVHVCMWFGTFHFEGVVMCVRVCVCVCVCGVFVWGAFVFVVFGSVCGSCECVVSCSSRI